MIAIHPNWPATLTPWQRVADGGYAPEIDTLLDEIDRLDRGVRFLVGELLDRERTIRISADLIEGLREREEARVGNAPLGADYLAHSAPRDYADDLVADSECAGLLPALERMAEAAQTETEMVRAFPAASDYGASFDLHNCCICAKSIHQNSLRWPYRCAIEEAIDNNIEIPAALARRAGLPGGTVCPEREEVQG